MRELVDDGAIGELRLIRSAFSYGLYDADNIRLRTDVEGGALMDVGCYCVSGSRLLGGEPRERLRQRLVRRDGNRLGLHGDDALPGRRARDFDCGTAMVERDELEAIGSEGSLFLDDPWHGNVPVIEVRREEGIERIELEQVDSYRLELENVSDAIRGEGELLLGREDAVAQARALEALHDRRRQGARSTFVNRRFGVLWARAVPTLR